MIKLTNINKHILKNINLQINEGELILIHGVSGSGKSTLLHIIASFTQPQSGTVEVDGDNIASLSDFFAAEYRRDIIGYITQAFYLLDALTVAQNLLIPTVIQDLPQNEIDVKIAQALQMAKIAHKAAQRVASLSGGEKQRCIIARALVNNPKILLCDEPTANLDQENSLSFIEIIKQLKTAGKTIIIATHDPLFEAANIADKVLKLKDGQFE